MGEEPPKWDTVMRIYTRSRIVIQATVTVLRLMPLDARRRVEEFVSVIRARSDYAMAGLCGDIDRASAMVFPFRAYEQDPETGKWTQSEVEPQVLVTLPIFRLFSRKAQVGIIAHEFAHAARASQLGQGWHERMQSRYAAEERLADSAAIRWGFGSHIRLLRRGRDRTVNQVLEERAPKIVRRQLRETQRQQDELRSLFAKEDGKEA